MKTNKFIYLFIIQFSCGYGWEDCEETEDYKEACYLYKESALAYRGSGSVRMIKRRELNN